ncbi:MAG: ATP-binding protein [Halobacteriaceae archaeon]
MRFPDSIRRRLSVPSAPYLLGLGVVYAVGLASLGVHLYHLLVWPGDVYASLLGVAFPLLLASVVLLMGVWVQRQHFGDLALRVGSWCLVGTLSLVAVSTASIAYQQAHGVAMADPLYVIVDHATVGAILGLLLGIYDGQRQRGRRELRAERAHARRLSDRLTVLNRVLRHDIRNTVNVILGNTKLLERGTSDTETVTRTINTKARELATLSDRARQLEQLLEREETPSTTLDVACVLEAKAMRVSDDHPDVAVETDLPESLSVRANPLIETAFDELLDNAVEHADADPTRIEVSAAPDPGSRTGSVRVRIADNGPGIPDSELDVLRRGHETGLEHASGLGLWLVTWVVEASGGTVDFDTVGGTTVSLVLPAAADGQRPADRPES